MEKRATAMAVWALVLAGCGNADQAARPLSSESAPTSVQGEGRQAEHDECAEHTQDEGHHREGAGHAAAQGVLNEGSGPRPTRVFEDGSRLFGAELSADRPVTPLSQIIADPDSFAGRVVKTEGTVGRVCQRMGCWMELQAEGAPAVRVPMAGHAFFLPRDVAGRAATIEGRIVVQPLSPEAREHLASEGAVALASPLSIEATGVVIR